MQSRMAARPGGRQSPLGMKRGKGLSTLALLASILAITGIASWVFAHWLMNCRKLEEDVHAERTVMAVEAKETYSKLPAAETTSTVEPISLTIFCAPKPFEPGAGGAQQQALLSWLRLDPSVKVVLVGNSSLEGIAARYPGRVVVESDVDLNFKGTPMFHSLIARARAADTRFSLFINGDIVLLSDFLSALRKVADRFQSFVLTAMRWDVEAMPFYFEEGTQKLLTVNGTEADEDAVRSYIKEHGSLHTYGGVDFWAWNNGPVPFHEVPMPPFTFGRGRYDNWFTHEMVESGYRALVDASDAITSVHVMHSYSHLVSQGSLGGNFWTINKKRNWEAFANIFLSRTVGTFSSQMGTAMHLPWKLATCDEPASGNMCLARRLKPFSCRCEYSPYVLHTQSEPTQVGKKLHCGNIVVDNDIEIPTLPSGLPVPGLPHTLDQLLPQVADPDGTVTLVAATSRYRELLVDFACRLTAINVTNLVIAAMDEDLYLYAFTQGLPVYFDVGPTSSHGSPLSAKEAAVDCDREAPCFHHYRQVKFNAILQALKRGYTVVWSDVDMVWLRNPVPHLHSISQGSLLVQSSVPDHHLAANGVPAASTDSGGIIFARSNSRTIEVFEAALAQLMNKHGKAPQQGKGPFFYAVLCGAKGQQRAAALDECTLPNGTPAVFLPREEFATGLVGKGGGGASVEECWTRGCYTLHNNLLGGGTAAKIRRLEDAKLWRFDVELRLCRHQWSSITDAS